MAAFSLAKKIDDYLLKSSLSLLHKILWMWNNFF